MTYMSHLGNIPVLERFLVLGVIVFYGVGDMVTTFIGVTYYGAVEAYPPSRFYIEMGWGYALAVKIASILLIFGVVGLMHYMGNRLNSTLLGKQLPLISLGAVSLHGLLMTINNILVLV